MLSPISGLLIGGSYYTGKKGVTKDDHSVWIGSIDYSTHHLNLRAEYASSRLYDSFKQDDSTETGWYGELSYRIKAVTPYLRYGIIDPDKDKDNDKWTEIVYGINYEIMPGFYAKLENRNFGGETGNSKVSEDYNEIGAAVSVAF